MAVLTFKLPRAPSRMTLHRLLTTSTQDAKLNTLHKTNHSVSCPRLEAALVVWVHACERCKLPIVIDSTARGNAAKPRDKFVKEGPPFAVVELSSMVFPSGWLFKFQKRHHLTVKHIHGEATSVNQAAVEEGRVTLQSITKSYAKKDLFNMEETAFFYCTAPTKSMATKQIAARKNVKTIMTVAVTCNADGCEISSTFCWSSALAALFGRKSGEDLGFQYTGTPKG